MFLLILGPLWVVVEFCEHGNLLTYLRKNRYVPEEGSSFTSTIDFVVRARLAWDISKGASFLETERVCVFLQKQIGYSTIQTSLSVNL